MIRKAIQRYLGIEPVQQKASLRDYIDATVRPGDLISGRAARGFNPEKAELVSTAFGAVSICANRVAMGAAGIPLRLYRPGRAADDRRSRRAKAWMQSGAAGAKAAQVSRTTEGMVEVTEHPSLELLSRPNCGQSGFDFRYLHNLYKLIAGDSYIVPIIEGRDLTELYILSPAFVKIVPGTDELIAGYRYGRDSTGTVTLAADEVWHGKLRANPFDPYYGWGIAAEVMDEHAAYAMVNDYQRALFQNETRPLRFVAVENIGVDEAKALEARINSHAGPNNAGRTIVVRGESLTFDTANVKIPADTESIDRQKYAFDVIAKAFGVPQSELDVNDANLASSDMGNIQYLRQTLMPRGVQDAEDFTRWILDDYLGLDGWVFVPDNIVGDDEAERRASLIELYNAGIVLADDVAQELGYPTLPDGMGQIPRINGQPMRKDSEPFRPFGLSAAKPETKKVENTACGCGCKSKKVVLQSEQLKAAWRGEGIVTKAIDEVSAVADDAPQAELLYRALVDLLHRRRDGILARITEYPMGIQLRSRLKQVSPERLRQILTAWGLSEAAHAEFAREAEETAGGLIDAIVGHGAQQSIRDLIERGVPDPTESGRLPILENDRAVEYFRGMRSQFVRDMAEVDKTTAEAVERALREGLEGGETIRQISSRVRNVFDGPSASGGTMTEARATMIARTEVAEAQTQGTLAGYAASPAVKGYKFMLAPNPCEFCEATARQYDGQTVPLGQPLWELGSEIKGVDGGTMKIDYKPTTVPIHPNCRCAVVGVV